MNNYEIYTLNDSLAVDFIGRYENLGEDLNKALAMAGVVERVTLPQVNVTPNKDKHRDYQSYYSPEIQSLVSEWYAPEIKLLGYSF